MKNIHLLQNILSKHSGECEHSIVANDTTSYELFFVHGKLETVRKAEHSSAQISVFVKHDGKLGSASFVADESATEQEIESKTQEALGNAKMIFDEPYELPCDDKQLDGVIPSNLGGRDEKQVAADVAKAVLSACTLNDCSINALEVFVTTRVNTVLNSKGVNKRQTKHTVSVEVIPTCNAEAESVELFETYEFGNLDEQAIIREIAARVEDVSMRAKAVKPQEKIDCPVILNPYDIREMFEELVSDAQYSSVYLHTNLHELGSKWQSSPVGDKLTITMRGVVDGSPASALFDKDGTSLCDKTIVKDGELVANFGASRFAQYLGKEATGALGCIDVESGNTTISELQSTPHLECVYLSGIQTDLYNDYIGGEIRLAYYFDGEKRIPVTGIAMSGKLSEVLNNITLSKERVVSGCYSGPEKIRLDKMNIF